MLAIVSISFAVTNDYTAGFGVWKTRFGKIYNSADAEIKAFSAFAHNDDKIRAHNAKGLNYTLAHNEFSDLTADEFFATRLGYSRSVTTRSTFAKKTHVVDPSVKVASSVNWVTAGAVTPVKNQARCGGCWAFSATGAMEGAYKIELGSLLSFSEEDLIQCDTIDSGCNGGLMDNAFRWVGSHGIAAESAYPYTSGSGTTGTCQSSKERNPVAYVASYSDVTSNSQSALMSAVSQQPVSIAIEADREVFQLYSGGVMDSTSCGTNLDHGVLVVGYHVGYQSSGYWLVKNSWGPTWGESGYIRLGMASYGAGICGMYSQPSYPTGMSDTSIESA